MLKSREEYKGYKGIINAVYEDVAPKRVKEKFTLEFSNSEDTMIINSPSKNRFVININLREKFSEVSRMKRVVKGLNVPTQFIFALLHEIGHYVHHNKLDGYLNKSKELSAYTNLYSYDFRYRFYFDEEKADEYALRRLPKVLYELNGCDKIKLRFRQELKDIRNNLSVDNIKIIAQLENELSLKKYKRYIENYYEARDIFCALYYMLGKVSIKSKEFEAYEKTLTNIIHNKKMKLYFSNYVESNMLKEFIQIMVLLEKVDVKNQLKINADKYAREMICHLVLFYLI